MRASRVAKSSGQPKRPEPNNSARRRKDRKELAVMSTKEFQDTDSLLEAQPRKITPHKHKSKAANISLSVRKQIFVEQQGLKNKWKVISQKLGGVGEGVIKNIFFGEMRKAIRRLCRICEFKSFVAVDVKPNVMTRLVESTIKLSSNCPRPSRCGWMTDPFKVHDFFVYFIFDYERDSERNTQAMLTAGKAVLSLCEKLMDDYFVKKEANEITIPYLHFSSEVNVKNEEVQSDSDSRVCVSAAESVTPAFRSKEFFYYIKELFDSLIRGDVRHKEIVLLVTNIYNKTESILEMHRSGDQSVVGHLAAAFRESGMVRFLGENSAGSIFDRTPAAPSNHNENVDIDRWVDVDDPANNDSYLSSEMSR